MTEFDFQQFLTELHKIRDHVDAQFRESQDNRESANAVLSGNIKELNTKINHVECELRGLQQTQEAIHELRDRQIQIDSEIDKLSQEVYTRIGRGQSYLMLGSFIFGVILPVVLNYFFDISLLHHQEQSNQSPRLEDQRSR